MKPVQNVQSMKPVQYAQVSYFALFSSLFLFNFEINGYFHIFFILFYYYFFFLEGDRGFGGGDIGRFY